MTSQLESLGSRQISIIFITIVSLAIGRLSLVFSMYNGAFHKFRGGVSTFLLLSFSFRFLVVSSFISFCLLNVATV